MLRLVRILCPVDFSESSAKVYDYAYSLARHYQAHLFVQHIIEPVPGVYRSLLSQVVVEDVRSRQAEEAERRIRELTGKHPAGTAGIETAIETGFPAESILQFAEQREVELIVMGTHGRRGLDRLMLGSTLERVMRKARCAVLAIHAPERDFVSPAGAEDPVRIRRVLWCTDFSENSPRALEFALSLASEYHAELTLLHVLEGPGEAGQERRALQALEDLVPDEARNWAKAVPLVLEGEPYRKIVEHAARERADLIVMGVRGRNIVDLAIFGSTTQRVIQLGPCPVLTVRT